MSEETAIPESSPRHAHLRKLAKEAEDYKKAKDAQHPTKVEYRTVYNSQGRPKYRKVTTMPSGNAYSEILGKDAVLKLRVKGIIKD